MSRVKIGVSEKLKLAGLVRLRRTNSLIFSRAGILVRMDPFWTRRISLFFQRAQITFFWAALAIFSSLVPGRVLAKEVNCENMLDCVVKQFYSDGKSLLLSPFHWDKKEKVEFILLATATAGVFLADEEFQKIAQRNRSHSLDELSNLVTPPEKIYPKVVIGSFYLGGFLFNSKKEKETAFYLLEALIFTQGITQGIKRITGRARPFADKGAFHFEGLKEHPSSYSLSFPSGHSATAFCLASVIAEQYDNKIIDWVSYGLAFLAAWARVNDNAHFASDVFFGGVLGNWVGKKIVRLNRNKKIKFMSLSFQTKMESNFLKVSLNF